MVGHVRTLEVGLHLVGRVQQLEARGQAHPVANEEGVLHHLLLMFCWAGV